MEKYNEMLECPLCKALNAKENAICHLCDTSLLAVSSSKLELGESEHIILDSVDVTRNIPSLKQVLLLLSILLFVSVPWLYLSDSFQNDSEVLDSRIKFYKAMEVYKKDQNKWHVQKEQVLQSMEYQKNDPEISKIAISCEQIPFSVILAYLDEDLAFFQEKKCQRALFPLENNTDIRFILSKQEKSIFPWKPMYALEVSIREENGRYQFDFLRLKKGEREVPIQFAWDYFAEELAILRGLAAFSGGIKHVNIHRKQSDEALTELMFDWTFDQHSIR
jgi:hypothetical protein